MVGAPPDGCVQWEGIGEGLVDGRCDQIHELGCVDQRCRDGEVGVTGGWGVGGGRWSHCVCVCVCTTEVKLVVCITFHLIV